MSSFNNGDISRLDTLFESNGFEWYSTDAPGSRYGSEAKDRTTLMGYFLERHRAHEHLTLEAFQFNGVSGGLAEGNFAFELTRSADQLEPTAYGGKGAVACWDRPQTILVWSMAREPFLRARLPLYVGCAVLAIVAFAVGLSVVVRRRWRERLRTATR